MKRIHIASVTAALAALTFPVASMAAEDTMSMVATMPNINIPVTELKWVPTGIPAPKGTAPLQAAPASGDLSKGEHATFIKMPAGYVSAIHTIRMISTASL